MQGYSHGPPQYEGFDGYTSRRVGGPLQPTQPQYSQQVHQPQPQLQPQPQPPRTFQPQPVLYQHTALPATVPVLAAGPPAAATLPAPSPAPSYFYVSKTAVWVVLCLIVVGLLIALVALQASGTSSMKRMVEFVVSRPARMSQ